MSEAEAIARLDALITAVRNMRAERWLREWPNGNSERPQRQPDYVTAYLRRQPQAPNPT